MRGKSSRQGSKVERVETKNNLNQNPKAEPHLSGACIRTLVKQLTSSKTKDTMNPNEPNTIQNLGETCGASNGGQRSVPPQHKKQVRRRLHTTRPYQERLLNMAEARREIVTALKSHRASMKKLANEQQETNSGPNSGLLPRQEKIKSQRNSRTYPPMESIKYQSNQSSSSNNMWHSTFYPPPSNPYSFWPAIQIANFPDNLNFALPSQPLGLNLNFQDFDNLDKTLYQNTNNNSPYFYSSPKSDLISSTKEFSNLIPKSEHEGKSSGLGLHQVMDEEEMAEMRSLGEQHEVEWNDNVNLITSAWWFKFLKNGEKGKGDAACSIFDDEVAQFPDWLSEGGSCLEQNYVIDKYFDACLHDPALPCMNIGEIEGMDGEWFT